MRRLLNGIRRFQRKVFLAQREAFEQLVYGQYPATLFVTCSDSRADPCLLTQSMPSELFVMRNAGNTIPPYDAPFGIEAVTIDYAVGVLKVRDVVICGHFPCGAGTSQHFPPQGVERPSVGPRLRHSVRAATPGSNPEQGNKEAKLDKRIAEQNVLVQMENLRSHPAVIIAEADRGVGIHGWVHECETGVVLKYERNAGRFERLESNRTAKAA